MKSFLFASAACLALATFSAQADAAIMASNPVSVADIGIDTSKTLAYDSAGATKLVVAISFEGRGASSVEPIVWDLEATYNDAPLSIVQYVNDTVTARGIQRAAILFLDNPAAGTNDLVIDFGDDAISGVGWSVVGLTGAAGGAPAASASAGGDGDEQTITVPSDGSYVIAAFVDNSGTAVADPTLSALLSSENVGSAVGASGFEEGVAAGSYTASFTQSIVTRPVTAAAAFEPVPEPASLGLFAFGLLGMVLRRTRSNSDSSNS